MTPYRPDGVLYSVQSSPSSRTVLAGRSSKSCSKAMGYQYRRSSAPIRVPGPTRVNSSFCSTVSMRCVLPVVAAGGGAAAGSADRRDGAVVAVDADPLSRLDLRGPEGRSGDRGQAVLPA